MIAAHLRLDDAHAIIDVTACDNFKKNVAGVIVARLKSSPTNVWRFVSVWSQRNSGWLNPVGRNFSCAIRSPEVSFYRLAHQRAHVLFVHPRSTVSTIPTIAASTGAPFWPMASLAARPSRTMSTFS